jgi:predicted transglutaminase-like cysteine proteinase
MIRLLTVAAAAALIAAPAAAQSVKISTAGKSPEQLHADIAKAAKKVCNAASVGASFPRAMYDSCYKHAMKNAVATANDPALARLAGSQMAAN